MQEILEQMKKDKPMFSLQYIAEKLKEENGKCDMNEAVEINIEYYKWLETWQS